jgi:hypothetical protein
MGYGPMGAAWPSWSRLAGAGALVHSRPEPGGGLLQLPPCVYASAPVRSAPTSRLLTSDPAKMRGVGEYIPIEKRLCFQ